MGHPGLGVRRLSSSSPSRGYDVCSGPQVLSVKWDVDCISAGGLYTRAGTDGTQGLLPPDRLLLGWLWENPSWVWGHLIGWCWRRSSFLRRGRLPGGSAWRIPVPPTHLVGWELSPLTWRLSLLQIRLVLLLCLVVEGCCRWAGLRPLQSPGVPQAVAALSCLRAPFRLNTLVIYLPLRGLVALVSQLGPQRGGSASPRSRPPTSSGRRALVFSSVLGRFVSQRLSWPLNSPCSTNGKRPVGS